MITFLPYSSFFRSFASLDNKRLMKQRVEAYQLINALLGVPTKKGKQSSYINHPAAKMWKGYVEALKLYFNVSLQEVSKRGFKNSLPAYKINPKRLKCPWWLGYQPFHNSHKASLLRKDKDWYSKKFTVSKKYVENGYIWPSDLNEEQKENINKYMSGKLKRNPYKIEELARDINK